MNETGATDPRQLELMQLQREYRHMELNRRAYAEESQSLLRKQQGTIDKLRKDNESLKNEIALFMRSSNKMMSNLQFDTIQNLSDQGERYAVSIEGEKKNITILEEQIQIMRQKVLQQRRAMGGVNASKENHYMIEKQIRILENRLDKSLIKFNEAIAHNKTLRDQIDDLRRERVVFENVYRKMERELQDKKRQMAEIIELSNQSYEQRDTYQMEIAAIEQANRKEQEEFEEQMITLSRILDNELQLPTFGAGKGKTLGRTGANSASGSVGESSDFGKSVKGMGATISGTNVMDESANFRERAQNFEEAFNKIASATGITDIDELVKTFIKNEEHNFSLFNYVNEQNNEIEKYEEQIQALKDEEMKFAQESGNDVTQHKQILKDLETKLQSSDSMAEKYEQRCHELQRVLESLKRGMQSIFSKIDLETDDSASEPVVTDSNMVHHLGLIEKKTNQLLQKYSSIRQLLYNADQRAGGSMDLGAPGAENVGAAASAQSLVTVLGAGPKVPTGQDLLHVNPPKSDEYHSDDEEDEDDEETRPLTREELKNRTMNRLLRRNQSQMGGAGAAGGIGALATKGNNKKKSTIKK